MGQLTLIVSFNITRLFIFHSYIYFTCIVFEVQFDRMKLQKQYLKL